jgi:hypothetical protein
MHKHRMDAHGDTKMHIQQRGATIVLKQWAATKNKVDAGPTYY